MHFLGSAHGVVGSVPVSLPLHVGVIPQWKNKGVWVADGLRGIVHVANPIINQHSAISVSTKNLDIRNLMSLHENTIGHKRETWSCCSHVGGLVRWSRQVWVHRWCCNLSRGFGLQSSSSWGKTCGIARWWCHLWSWEYMPLILRLQPHWLMWTHSVSTFTFHIKHTLTWCHILRWTAKVVAFRWCRGEMEMCAIWLCNEHKQVSGCAYEWLRHRCYGVPYDACNVRSVCMNA